MARLKNGVFAFITTISSVIFTTFFPSVVTADILQFGPGALPTCAYECVPLWSAQYDCQGESTPGECFCTSRHLNILLEDTEGSLCEDKCPETGGGAQVRIWFRSVCVAFLEKETSTSIPEPEPTPTSNSSDPTDTSTQDEDSDDVTTTENSNKSNESSDPGNRAIEWWKKHWHWFLIVFLAITVPITIYALWFPCRKWTRKQIIQRRSRRPLPPVDPTAANNNPYANGGLASPGIPPIPSGVFTNHQWADPFSPSLTRDGVGYFPRYIAPLTPSPAPMGAVRQESWERRVREEFEGKKTLGEKLAFWKKDHRGGEGDIERKIERE